MKEIELKHFAEHYFHRTGVKNELSISQDFNDLVQYQRFEHDLSLKKKLLFCVFLFILLYKTLTFTKLGRRVFVKDKHIMCHVS